MKVMDISSLIKNTVQIITRRETEKKQTHPQDSLPLFHFKKLDKRQDCLSFYPILGELEPCSQPLIFCAVPTKKKNEKMNERLLN